MGNIPRRLVLCLPCFLIGHVCLLVTSVPYILLDFFVSEAGVVGMSTLGSGVSESVLTDACKFSFLLFRLVCMCLTIFDIRCPIGAFVCIGR
jgi:hypothetical protein